MSPLRGLYLALAVWGTVHPMTFFMPWLLENGINIDTLIQAWKITPMTTGLYWDLLISAIVLTVWIVAEVAVRRNWIALLAIPATFLIGVSCGLPLYLFLRSYPID